MRSHLRFIRASFAVLPILAVLAGCVSDFEQGPVEGAPGKAASEAASSPAEREVDLDPGVEKVPSLPLPAEVKNRYTVVFKKDVANPAAAADALVKQYGGSRHHVFSRTLRGFSAVNLSDDAVESLKKDPRVAHVTPSRQHQALAIQTNPGWALDRMDDPVGSDNSYEHYFDGSNTHIYIVDTGIRGDHAEFAGRIGNGVNTADSTSANSDTFGHGTGVAAVAAGKTKGIARGATLHSVKITSGGTAWSDDMLEGIDWVVNNAKAPAVMNLSFDADTEELRDALSNAATKGILVTKAAGNNNVEACNDDFGNQAEGIVVVGATTPSDTRRSTSDFGACVDIFAPGSSVDTASNTSSSATTTMSGTSLAAPYVAGIAALMRQQRPEWLMANVRIALLNSAWTGKLVGLDPASPNRLANSLHTGVMVSGPSEIDTGLPSDPSQTASFVATTVGGNTVWTYAWEKSVDGKSFVPAGTSKTLSVPIASGTTGTLSVRVTATSGGKTVVSSKFVKIISSDLCTNPKYCD